jgi:hypothetical protein
MLTIAGWTGGRSSHHLRTTDSPDMLATRGSDGTDGPMLDPSVPARQGDDGIDMVEPPTMTRITVAPFARPVRPIDWYQRAAGEYEASSQLLAALHAVESNAAGDACIPNRHGSGAIGPFQFKPSTFAQFGVDGNHDGVVDICGFADSVFSAARYLRATGADADPASAASRRALARYGTDVERVVALSRLYEERDRSGRSL